VILAIIAALSRNRGIGKNGKLPWHVSEDLRRFKRLTMGHTVLMGRTTWESLGKPLPGRRNVVLTGRVLPGVETYGSAELALVALQAEERVFVIGGGRVYARFLDHADELYLTLIDREVDADTFFPPYEHLLGTRYECVSTEPHDGYRFEDYRRK
jgi:dihydrofolate reductase